MSWSGAQDDEIEESDEEEGFGAPLRNAKELAGMKVKHNADELAEGETVILTLADRNILDDKGDLHDGADELENALVVILYSSSPTSSRLSLSRISGRLPPGSAGPCVLCWCVSSGGGALDTYGSKDSRAMYP